jgi:hypothetical protein
MLNQFANFCFQANVLNSKFIVQYLLCHLFDFPSLLISIQIVSMILFVCSILKSYYKFIFIFEKNQNLKNLVIWKNNMNHININQIINLTYFK